MTKSKETLVVFGMSGLVGNVLRRQLGEKYNLVNLSFPQIDITDLFSVRQALKKNEHAIGVVNLAAATDTGRAFSDSQYRQTCFDINYQGAENVAIACQENKLFGIHVSTDYVYDGTKKSPYVETDHINPIEPYGQSKALGEGKATLFGMSVATLAFPYTRNPLRLDSVSKIVTQLKDGQPIRAFDDQYITPTFLEDFVTGLDLMIAARPTGKYFVVGSSVETPYSMRVKIAEIMGINPDIIQRSSVDDYNQKIGSVGRHFQKNLHLENNKLVTEFGFTPKTLTEGLMEMRKQLGTK